MGKSRRGLVPFPAANGTYHMPTPPISVKSTIVEIRVREVGIGKFMVVIDAVYES